MSSAIEVQGLELTSVRGDDHQYFSPLPQTEIGQSFDWKKITIPFENITYINFGVTSCDALIDDLELNIY